MAVVCLANLQMDVPSAACNGILLAFGVRLDGPEFPPPSPVSNPPMLAPTRLYLEGRSRSLTTHAFFTRLNFRQCCSGHGFDQEGRMTIPRRFSTLHHGPSAEVLCKTRVFAPMSFCVCGLPWRRLFFSWMVAECYFDVLSSHQPHESLLRFLFLFPKRVPSQIYFSQSF